MGQWSEWGDCECDDEERNCGTCNKWRSRRLELEGQNGGDTSCDDEWGDKGCNIECSKF